MKLSYKQKSLINNQSGMAMIEAIPLLVIFAMFVSYGLGLFGSIHTAILYSIGARNYAFETFRNRTNTNYFREEASGLTQPMFFEKKGFRYHYVGSDTDSRDLLVATSRPITIGRNIQSVSGTTAEHQSQIFELLQRNQRVSVNPLWVKVGYGLCINSGCGETQQSQR